MISFAHKSIDYDFTRINLHCPSYADSAPGSAVKDRAAHKSSKYTADSRSKGHEFVPFVMDQYGCMDSQALVLLKEIQAESLLAPGAPNPARLSKSDFLHLLSLQWQFDNARIIVRWLTQMRLSQQRRSHSAVGRRLA